MDRKSYSILKMFLKEQLYFFILGLLLGVTGYLYKGLDLGFVFFGLFFLGANFFFILGRLTRTMSTRRLLIYLNRRGFFEFLASAAFFAVAVLFYKGNVYDVENFDPNSVDQVYGEITKVGEYDDIILLSIDDKIAFGWSIDSDAGQPLLDMEGKEIEIFYSQEDSYLYMLHLRYFEIYGFSNEEQVVFSVGDYMDYKESMLGSSYLGTAFFLFMSLVIFYKGLSVRREYKDVRGFSW